MFFGLSVLVHDSLRMGRVQRFGDLSQQPERASGLQRPLTLHQPLQVHALHPLHDEIWRAVDLAEVVHAHNVRVLDPRGGGGLDPEALEIARVARELGRDHLHRARQAERDVGRAVDDPHPAARDLNKTNRTSKRGGIALSGSNIASTPIERSVRDQVHDHIVQRCSETSLRAEDVASSLNVSTRTLHRVLAACGETFGAMLIQARVDLAVRMLQSPLFDRLTTAEIGRRAGFSDASHFVKVLRSRTGQTPLRIRRGAR